MKLSLILFLTTALVMSPFAGFSTSCSSYFAWICNRDKKPVLPEEQRPVETRTSTWSRWFAITTFPLRFGNGNKKLVLPEEQQPIDTQHRAFNWPCWLGLPSCHVTTEDGDQKTAFHKHRLPVGTQHRAFNWPCWLGLPTCYVTTEDGDQKMAFHKQQLPVHTQYRASSWPCWLGLPSCHVTTEVGDQKTAFHKHRLPVGTQHRASNWPRQLGLSEHPRWIRYRVSKVVTPKDPKQQSIGLRQKACSLHDTVGHIYDHFVQRHVTCILMDVLKHICILSLLRISRGLWRNIRRLWGQVSY